MKIVKNNQSVTFQNGPTCMAYEYPMEDRDINGSLVELSGRYPIEGQVINEKCKEMSFVIEGNGKLVVEGIEYLLSAGDLVLVNPNEKYYWEGNLKLFIPCTPAWFPGQHKVVK